MVLQAPTASGKTLAFQIPMLESLCEPGAHALMLYPTKADPQWTPTVGSARGFASDTHRPDTAPVPPAEWVSLTGPMLYPTKADRQGTPTVASARGFASDTHRPDTAPVPPAEWVSLTRPMLYPTKADPQWTPTVDSARGFASDTHRPDTATVPPSEWVSVTGPRNNSMLSLMGYSPNRVRQGRWWSVFLDATRPSGGASRVVRTE